jgi:hypothetical protein
MTNFDIILTSVLARYRQPSIMSNNNSAIENKFLNEQI